MCTPFACLHTGPYFGEVTHLTIGVDGLEQPLSMIETNDYGADDLPLGADIRLAYDPEAFVLLADEGGSRQ